MKSITDNHCTITYSYILNHCYSKNRGFSEIHSIIWRDPPNNALARTKIVEQVNEFKYLDIIMESTLNFEAALGALTKQILLLQTNAPNKHHANPCRDGPLESIGCGIDTVTPIL